MKKPFELIAEVLETVVNSLPIDPTDQARLKACVVELHKHNKSATNTKSKTSTVKA